MDSLKHIYKNLLKRDLQVTTCGKPDRITFDYAAKLGHGFASNINSKVSNFYMIGDNP